MPLPDVSTVPVSLSPAGSFESGTLMLLALFLKPPGRPLLLTRCKLISFGPADETFQTADHEAKPPASLRLPLSSLLPTDSIRRPPPEPPPRNEASGPAADRKLPISPRLISTVPCSGPAVPDWKFEFRWTFCATTSRLVILIGPAGISEEVIVIWSNFLVMTCVKNGKPAIDTCGFFGKPCFWICVAASLSANAFAPKSSATSSTMIERSQISALRPRRRLGG